MLILLGFGSWVYFNYKGFNVDFTRILMLIFQGFDIDFTRFWCWLYLTLMFIFLGFDVDFPGILMLILLGFWCWFSKVLTLILLRFDVDFSGIVILIFQGLWCWFFGDFDADFPGILMLTFRGFWCWFSKVLTLILLRFDVDFIEILGLGTLGLAQSPSWDQQLLAPTSLAGCSKEDPRKAHLEIFK